MCQMSIILEKNGREELVAENAAVLEVTGDGIEIGNLFESPRTLENVRVKKIDILGGKIFLAAAGEGAGA